MINYLKLAGILSFSAAFVHLMIIVGGGAWYRFFGAGERMAKMAEQGQALPTVITLAIAATLVVMGAYAWSAAGILPKLPLLKVGLALITLLYLLRGGLGFFALLVPEHSWVQQNTPMFWLWSSTICLAFGLVHLKGFLGKWGL